MFLLCISLSTEAIYKRLRERDREQQMINEIEIDTHLSVSETSKSSLVDLDKEHYIPPLTWKGNIALLSNSIQKSEKLIEILRI